MPDIEDRLLIYSQECPQLSPARRRWLGELAQDPAVLGPVHARPDGNSGTQFSHIVAFDATTAPILDADIGCGTRLLACGADPWHVTDASAYLREELCFALPAKAGEGNFHLTFEQTDALLAGGARWAVERGLGSPLDLTAVEGCGCIEGVDAGELSKRAKRHQQREFGTLGSSRHSVVVYSVEDLFSPCESRSAALTAESIVISIHTGSGACGRQLSCDAVGGKGPLRLNCLAAAENSALATRQLATHILRNLFKELFGVRVAVLEDHAHNSVREELHTIDAEPRQIIIHRQGAVRCERSRDSLLLVGSSSSPWLVCARAPGVAFDSVWEPSRCSAVIRSGFGTHRMKMAREWNESWGRPVARLKPILTIPGGDRAPR